MTHIRQQRVVYKLIQFVMKELQIKEIGSRVLHRQGQYDERIHMGRTTAAPMSILGAEAQQHYVSISTIAPKRRGYNLADYSSAINTNSTGFEQIDRYEYSDIPTIVGCEYTISSDRADNPYQVHHKNWYRVTRKVHSSEGTKYGKQPTNPFPIVCRLSTARYHTCTCYVPADIVRDSGTYITVAASKTSRHHCCGP